MLVPKGTVPRYFTATKRTRDMVDVKEKNESPTSSLTSEEEAAVYAKKRRFAKIFGWILAGVVLLAFITTIVVLAGRGGPNPMLEPSVYKTEE